MKWNAAGACACAWGIVAGCDPIRIDPPTRVALADAEAALESSYCERMFACECQDRIFASVDACMDDVRMQIAALEQPPDIEGISYDPFCLGEKVDAFDELACASTREDDGGCARPCFIYHGEVSEGDICRTTPTTVYSNCAKRWLCDVDSCTGDTCTGVCVDPCEGNVDDDPPRELDAPCTSHTQCASGYCPAGVCAMPPADADALVCSTIAEIR